MKRMTITGYVGRDVEFRSDATSKDFATFSVGVLVGTKDNPKTDWIDVSCSGSLLGIAKYIKQGCKIFVDGFPSVNAYINKEKKTVANQKLFANHMEILAFKSDASNTYLANMAELSITEPIDQSNNIN